MYDVPDTSGIGALLGDRARARMLAALMDGRALTATELALEADIVPSTASSHLGKLHAAGLLAVERQGRHRYFRLAGVEVAEVLEGLMGLAVKSGRQVRTGPRDITLRAARVCYDHLAGDVAVRMLASLRARNLIVGGAESPALSEAGRRFFSTLTIDITAGLHTRRPLCRLCLDWSERRPHLGGLLGAHVLRHVFKQRWARQETRGRAVLFSKEGRQAFAKHFLES
jgi:DNA-binding transcriptional ArsR family regulator